MQSSYLVDLVEFAISMSQEDQQKREIVTEIKNRGLDTLSAQIWAAEGKIEAWVHKYLQSGTGGSTNPAFSDALKREKRWWRGPLNLDLDALSPAVGPEPEMEYVVDPDNWATRTGHYAQSFTDSTALPPLIIEYRTGELSIRDGNTRYGAMKRLGWPRCWVIIWYNSEEDYLTHSVSVGQ